MTPSDLPNIGSFVSVISIPVTLLFLLVQICQATAILPLPPATHQLAVYRPELDDARRELTWLNPPAAKVEHKNSDALCRLTSETTHSSRSRL